MRSMPQALQSYLTMYTPTPAFTAQHLPREAEGALLDGDAAYILLIFKEM